MALHPFDPATPQEIEYAVKAIRSVYKDQVLHFKTVQLQEPPKAVMVPFLKAERANKPIAPPNRQVSITWHIKYSPRYFEAIVDCTAGEIVHHIELPREANSPGDRIEHNEACAAALASPLVKAELERLQLGDTAVVLDPWDYGRDDEHESRRLCQIFFYTRNPKNNAPDSNHYAFPLDFMAIVDDCLMEVVRIDYLPLGSAPGNLSVPHLGPRKLGHSIEPEYDHGLQSFPASTTMKPLNVTQPEGASFQIDGQLIEWENWRFRLGWNWREGMVLHDVTFNGRETFYRLALSEMFVPYGDGRGSIHRKSAFDLGSVGAGICANDLALGCDCLGLIKYFSGTCINALGEPVLKNNAVCLHEEDAGIQSKHTNHRTGKATVIRKRQLVLQTIITVSNYEYIFYWIFDQSGEIEFETRATGIVSTTPLDPDNTDALNFGTRMSSGVLAPNHQHLFNLRIDPAIDGHNNTVKYTDTLPIPTHPETNPYGVGYITQDTTIERSSIQQTDPLRARTFKIVNENVINPATLTPVGYKIMTIHSQMLLAQPDSWHAKRAAFAKHPLWITKYQDNEHYPAGRYTNQSRGPKDNVETYVNRNDDVRNTDVVVWHTFGFTHNPRAEDWPLMPVESAKVMFKPNNFFTHSPCLNVPPSNQAFNKSTAYDATLVVGADSKTKPAVAPAQKPCCSKL